MKLKQMRAIHTWYRLHGHWMYSISSYEIGVSVNNYTSAHKAKRAYKEAIKGIIKYREAFEKECITSWLREHRDNKI